MAAVVTTIIPISITYKTYGHEMESVYEKISRKKQGSKAFKRALTERDNKTNQFINQLPLRRTKVLVVENLNNLKQKTKGKLYKTFVNKMQRWSYRDVLDRLALLSEELGFDFQKLDHKIKDEVVWIVAVWHDAQLPKEPAS